jgi:hypothetical protein
MAAALEKSVLSPPVFDDSIPEMTERARQLVGVVTCSKNLGQWHPAITKILEEDEIRRLRRSEFPHSARWLFQPPSTPFERRRLRILNALFWALERCGAAPALDQRDGWTL